MLKEGKKQLHTPEFEDIEVSIFRGKGERPLCVKRFFLSKRAKAPEELKPERLRKINQHLSFCDKCTKELDELTKIPLVEEAS